MISPSMREILTGILSNLVGVDDVTQCLFGSNVGRNASGEGNELLLL